MDIFKKCFNYDETDEVKAMGLYPYSHALESAQDIEVIMEGKREIMVGSNNYLGLTNDERVIRASIEAIKKFGTGVSGSRFLNGTLTLHLQLEKEIAEFLNKEATLTFSSGFQTNLGIIAAIATRNDVIFSDRENHASIYDGIKLSYASVSRYKHNNMLDLEKKLQETPTDKGKIIITDGIFSMSGDIANLPEIVRLGKLYNARIMVDDAHSLGVLGECGRGTAEYFGLEDDVDIIMGTFSKSLASLGGHVSAKKEVIEYIKHKSRPYIYSASIPPSNAAATLEALRILKSDPSLPKKLLDITLYMRKALEKRGVKVAGNVGSPIIPIYTYSLLRTLVACKILFDKGVYVNPVVPPASPEDECMIRTSYTATHTKELMDEAASIIADVLNGLPDQDDDILTLWRNYYE